MGVETSLGEQFFEFSISSALLSDETGESVDEVSASVSAALIDLEKVGIKIFRSV